MDKSAQLNVPGKFIAIFTETILSIIMTNYKADYKKITATQGMYPYFDDQHKYEGDRMLCSDCLQDEGLRLNAEKIGIESSDKCPNCGARDGRKLTKELTRELCYLFFVRGTTTKFNYGGFPLVQMNEERFNTSEIAISRWLEDDVRLLEKTAEVGFFNYSPRHWMFGENEPLRFLQDPATMNDTITHIFKSYPVHLIDERHPFYRIRINPAVPHGPEQYDSPPEGCAGNNRFDAPGISVLYGSPDLELCIHECRVTVEDDLYVAKLMPVRQLRLLNLAAWLKEEGRDEFTSMDLAMHFLFSAGKHSYAICRQIAIRAKEEDFDGLIFPSYFSYIRTGHMPFDTMLGMSIRRIKEMEELIQAQIVPNIALFGRPVAEGKVTVQTINKVVLNAIRYDMTFGPAFLGDDVNLTDKEGIIEQKAKETYKRFMEAFNAPDAGW